MPAHFFAQSLDIVAMCAAFGLMTALVVGAW